MRHANYVTCNELHNLCQYAVCKAFRLCILMIVVYHLFAGHAPAECCAYGQYGIYVYCGILPEEIAESNEECP